MIDILLFSPRIAHMICVQNLRTYQFLAQVSGETPLTMQADGAIFVWSLLSETNINYVISSITYATALTFTQI